ncbi:hypothetical protein SETIT_9G521000v2 [Setaria italica]|uniref:Uncharacterized protein n=1 Tax=Setaria italica TaxID=4555 RepID=A0A368SV89_SETIT|nr:hypothetical protein SETIT_9G521000v2 [Setaria italica]
MASVPMLRTKTKTRGGSTRSCSCWGVEDSRGDGELEMEDMRQVPPSGTGRSDLAGKRRRRKPWPRHERRRTCCKGNPLFILPSAHCMSSITGTIFFEYITI